MAEEFTPCTRGYYACLNMAQDQYPEAFEKLLCHIGELAPSLYCLAVSDNNLKLLSRLNSETFHHVPISLLKLCTTETLQFLLDKGVYATKDYLRIFPEVNSKGMNKWLCESIKSGDLRLSDGKHQSVQEVTEEQHKLYQALKAQCVEGILMVMYPAAVRVALMHNDVAMINHMAQGLQLGDVRKMIDQELVHVDKLCNNDFLMQLTTHGLVSAETLVMIRR